MVQVTGNPKEAQQKALQTLLKEYSQTAYGRIFHAEKAIGIQEYRESFPIVNHHTLLPYIA